MNILLLGAHGQLGRTFLSHGGLGRRGTLFAGSRNGQAPEGVRGVVADLSAPEALAALLDETAPHVIVNAAAYTAVDKAEQEESAATMVNATALAYLGRWAAEHGALLVHYSTDYVFDGTASLPYPEDAPTAPAGAYGRSKLAGEEALRATDAPHYIFRTAWVYSAVGQNFLRTMLRLGAERDEIRVVADQHGTPTDTGLIVEASLVAIDRWLASAGPVRKAVEGTYHLTAGGDTTWHGFADALLTAASERKLISRTPRVIAITTADYPTPARRPAYSVLDTRHFARTFAFDIPHWKTGLDQVLTSLSEPTE